MAAQIVRADLQAVDGENLLLRALGRSKVLQLAGFQPPLESGFAAQGDEIGG